MFGCHPAVKSRNTMMPCEWWSMYGTDCEVLQRLVVRVLAQTVSSSPCERNWSTFSLIHTNKRNRIGYERLQKLVYCHYNMKLRERLLRSERRRKAQEDPLDLMTVGQHAYAEDAEDDLVYQWVRSDDLDTSDGRPEPHIAAEAETQGINVDKHVEQQRSPDEAFDPLTRSPEGSPRQSLSRGTRGGETLSDTETESESDAGNESGDDDGGDKGDDDSDDSKDDYDGGGNGDGGDTGGSQDKRPLSPFTREENFDHSTQDPDHGSRPGEPRPRLVYNKTYTRQKLLQKKKTHKLSDFEEELLAKCMRDTSVRGKRGGSRFGSRTREGSSSYRPQHESGSQTLESSSSSVPQYGHGYGPSGYATSDSSSYGTSFFNPGQEFTSAYGQGYEQQYGYGQQYGYQGASYVPFPDPYQLQTVTITQYPRMGVLIQFGEDEYQRYVREYLNWYHSTMTWAQYCQIVEQQYYAQPRRDGDDDYEPPRNSM
ncbi:uncharacterized protein LOC131253295 [Magnolia sinica]|uniref:uncharacterized protein LOC131253295 n=1 Tax=Magnolia sinica TaxID=86752 RepID=UPI00265B5A15|nr:uncharacterized protein LOC131253295 [Magnolia sinica]